ncbi:hypothetical protein BG55_15820 [Erwinia mallotivora]|uniref:Uncharacterized protein n=3 Tax=Erwinia mallotivora TaxID=69222 RepID=A0A014LYI4_9GAMM|nr:hypothetical protein BG55_15820 [Erwinia mallotivora]
MKGSKAGKFNVYAIPFSAMIIGVALIFAALIEQGLILQPAGSLAKGQVIATSSGHVNLGTIYAENKMLDVILTTSQKSGQEMILMSLTGINPWDYEALIGEALKKSIITSKAGYKVQYSMKGDIDNVTLASEGILVVKTYIKYQTEYQPDFDYSIIARKYKLPINEPVKSFTVKKVKRIVDNSQKQYKKNMFLVGDNDDRKSRRNTD